MDHFVLEVLSGYLFLHRLSMKKESCGYNLKWPVTGKVFKTLTDQQSCLFHKFYKSKKTANSNYHMRIC